mgnify:CR=1 FL=1
MWPFWHKKLGPKKPELKPPVSIGERFKYLGVDMICCRHFAWPYDCNIVAAEYVTNLGEIKQIVFTPSDWNSLKAELGRPRA